MLIQSNVDDEISDLVTRVRDAADDDVAIVVPAGSRALQTPLNARLLQQLAAQSGKRTAIVSDDSRVQQLARMSGFATFASVTAYERGIEMGAPAAPPPLRSHRVDGSGAVAVAPPKPPPITAFSPAPAGVAPPPVRPGGPPLQEVLPLESEPQPRNRRPLYFAAAGVAALGIILFLLLSPSATITLTVAATPVSVNPTIQGSADPSAASQGDHLLTQVVTASGQSAFQATPTGQQTVPAAPATTLETISASFPIQGTIPAGTQFESADPGHTIIFGVTKDTYICVGPGGPPQNCAQKPNADVPVQDETPGSSGNVAANTLTYWPPSQQPVQCQVPGTSCGATNAKAASGGADQKQQTVASATDVANWKQQVEQLKSQLTTQVNSELQSKAPGKTFAVDPGGNGKSIVFRINPPVPSSGSAFSPVQISVTANATAAAYDPNDVKKDVIADLQGQIPQGYQLAEGKLSMQPVVVTQASTDGTVILSVSATDYSQPVVNIEGLKSQLAGKNPGDAERIIHGRIDKVQAVEVSEFPFGLPYLPFFSSRIQIDENFVPLSPSS